MSVALKSCPTCRWPRPLFGYQSTSNQFFGRCPACGYTSLPAASLDVAKVFWQTANAPDQQGKLTMPLR